MGTIVAAMTPVAALLAGGGVYYTRRSRRLDRAESSKVEQETRKLAAESSAIEVATARSMVSAVREDMAAQRLYLQGRIDEQTARIDDMVRLAAAHAAWDRQVMDELRQQNPTFPPPPPLA